MLFIKRAQDIKCLAYEIKKVTGNILDFFSKEISRPSMGLGNKIMRFT
jgi:hypothetical protein